MCGHRGGSDGRERCIRRRDMLSPVLENERIDHTYMSICLKCFYRCTCGPLELRDIATGKSLCNLYEYTANKSASGAYGELGVGNTASLGTELGSFPLRVHRRPVEVE